MTSNQRLRSQRAAAGFTLIELMITVAIVAILASIAMPSYQAYVRRGQLADAFKSLADMRVKMEQYYQDNKFYGTDLGYGVVRHAAWLRGVSGLEQVLHGELRGRRRAPSQTFTLTATGIGGADHRLRLHAEPGRHQGHRPSSPTTRRQRPAG